MKSTKNTQIIATFIKLLNSSITLTEQDIQYWKSNANDLPISLIKYFSSYLKKENAIMAKNIANAIKNDPKIVLEIKKKKRNIIKKIATYYSHEEDNEAEKLLLENLNSTND